MAQPGGQGKQPHGPGRRAASGARQGARRGPLDRDAAQARLPLRRSYRYPGPQCHRDCVIGAGRPRRYDSPTRPHPRCAPQTEPERHQSDAHLPAWLRPPPQGPARRNRRVLALRCRHDGLRSGSVGRTSATRYSPISAIRRRTRTMPSRRSEPRWNCTRAECRSLVLRCRVGISTGPVIIGDAIGAGQAHKKATSSVRRDHGRPFGKISRFFPLRFRTRDRAGCRLSVFAA